ncbi:MAG: fumarylacetoacetate hydrolase family protein [Planctomycetes bacterium]|nr:fumarylacetoacetate hydrolase family protein [Planctomycetota bacterium]
MKLAKFRRQSGERAIGRLEDDGIVRSLNLAGGQYQSLTDILEADDPQEVAEFLTDTKADPIPVDEIQFLAPIDQQEVWAAGVTYKRSRSARMEESEAAASCYDLVYVSPRPELFMKATPHRVVGPGESIRIREDSNWNVPEPELTLVLNSRMKIVGYTIGNDMSSREIEGDNPLYLPQAKVYNQCAGLGPVITLALGMPHREEIGIELAIKRDGVVVFQGTTNIGQMNRTFETLVGWLARDNSFPNGAFLMTGTGIVPDSNFTLEEGDVVDITIDGIGTLSNPVVQG